MTTAPTDEATALEAIAFRRGERAEAHRRWPDEFADTDEEYYTTVEGRWRDTTQAAAPTLRAVVVTVAELVEFAGRTGGSPADPSVRERYADSIPEDRTVPRPPPPELPVLVRVAGSSTRSAAAARAERRPASVIASSAPPRRSRRAWRCAHTDHSDWVREDQRIVVSRPDWTLIPPCTEAF